MKRIKCRNILTHGKRSLHVMMRKLHNPGATCDSRILLVVVPPRYLRLGCVSAELFQKEPWKFSLTLRKKNFRTHQLLTTLLVHIATELLVTMVFQTGGCEFVSEMYSTAWRSLLCQESKSAKPTHQQLYQWIILRKYIKQNPLGTIHIWHTLIPQEWWIYIRPILILTPMTQWVQ